MVSSRYLGIYQIYRDLIACFVVLIIVDLLYMPATIIVGFFYVLVYLIFKYEQFKLCNQNPEKSNNQLQSKCRKPEFVPRPAFLRSSWYFHFHTEWAQSVSSSSETMAELSGRMWDSNLSLDESVHFCITYSTLHNGKKVRIHFHASGLTQQISRFHEGQTFHWLYLH